MSTSKCFFVAGFFGMLGIVGAASCVRAETIVSSPITSDTTWTKEFSPYVLTTETIVDASSTLTIGPGVSVIARKPTPTGYSYSGISVNPGSKLNVEGTPSKHVKIGGGVGHVYVRDATANVVYADIQSKDIGLQLYNSNVKVSSSTFSHSSVAGIMVSGGKVDIVNSRIENNDLFGIELFLFGGVDKNFSIHNSVITNNAVWGVSNRAKYLVDTSSNWWGTTTGPTLMEGEVNKVDGLVKYDPWLMADPVPDLIFEKVECCSSVLFIPGLEGTRLYGMQNLPLGLDSTPSRLWEPLYNSAVQRLYLNPDGSSIDSTIYSDEPIDKAIGLKGVYEKFMTNLTGLVSAGTISEWKSFGYDWRKSISDVVAGPEKRATTTVTLLDTVMSLAARSKTGKVTLVAHSNGGLVAKYLVKRLADIGKTELIDNVISVAVPYLGTPQAILGLLHGSDQEMASGLIVRESIARGLGVNMASAYSLLPSIEYFSHIFGPVVTFASTTIAGVNNGKYPVTIDSFDLQKKFVLGSGESRVVADSFDTTLPTNGNELLMNIAETIHGAIDLFHWPENIATWAIVGWNQITATGVKYSEKQKCWKSFIGLACDPRPVHEKIASNMGDGTVIAESAEYGASTTLSMDLKTIAVTENIHFDHTNILESSSTISLINSIIQSGLETSIDPKTFTRASTTDACETSCLPAGVTLGRVTELGGLNDSYLSVSTHSPVDLHIYDSKGHHTGAVSPPTGTEEVYEAFESNIPGSDYSKSDSGDTFINLPDDGQLFSVEINGNGVGEFTLDVERKRGMETLQTVEYSVIPTSPLTVATTTVQSGGDASGSGNAVVSTLSIDEDGDGIPDATILPNSQFDPATYLEMYKKTISAISDNVAHSKSLIARIGVLEKQIKSGKLKMVKKFATDLDKTMVHIKFKDLTAIERDNILDMFDHFLKRFE